MATATIQMKNSAIDSTSEIFSADQVSMCRSWRRARRGPRPDRPRPREPRPDGAAASPLRASAAAVAGGTAADAPVGGGTGGAPTGPPVTVVAVGPVVAAPALCARIEPVVGIDWVEVTDTGSAGAFPSGTAPSPSRG